MLSVARIFEESDGYHVCNEESDTLDARGKAYPTKAEALRAADRMGYTHAIGSGTTWANDNQPIQRIPARYREAH